MSLPIRACLAALCLGVGGLACAAGWSVKLGNGQALNIVEGATATRSGYFLERRYPDGARDPQFGTAGRAFFTMGSDNSPPSALQVDAAGRILVSGAAPGTENRTAAAVLRFLPGGQVDATWGQQGRSLAMSASGDASAADVLPFVDGSVLVLGVIEDQQTQRVALWRFGSTGQLDTTFANRGVLVSALPQSQGLSIQQSADGTVFIAVQTGSADKPWLEVHRWRTGDAGPMRIARQEFPEDWVGPAVLTPRGASWVWLDASQPLTPPLELTTVTPTSIWSSTPVALSTPRPAEAASASGHAALNPFSQDGPGGSGFAALTLDDLAWPGLLAAALAVLGGGLWWWWRRE